MCFSLDNATAQRFKVCRLLRLDFDDFGHDFRHFGRLDLFRLNLDHFRHRQRLAFDNRRQFGDFRRRLDFGHRQQLGAGCISEDSRGRWYLNVTVKVKKQPLAAPSQVDAVGIDLGLKEFLATSDGMVVEAGRFYRDLEPALAAAQRAGKTQRVRALHDKIRNRRKDSLHKESTALVRKHGAIFVGDVNASGLAKTSAAKSVLDAGWSAFRTMLQYKCDDAGRWFRKVNEAYSTQDCSACASRSGPKGRDQLHVRRWQCPVCRTEHDRDVNAAVNIRNRGLAWLEEEFAAAGEAKAREAVVNEAAQVAAVGHDRPAVGILVL